MLILTILILFVAGLLFIGIVLLGWGIGTYNYFRSGQQNIKTQWSNIKTEYQRRYDLFLNLARSVKSYKKHEKSTLKEVIEARNKLSFKGSIPKQMKDMGFLDNLFSKLAVVFERYPELKAGEQHNKLMEELRVTEDRINIARTDFNDIVRSYNIKAVTFPSSIIAHIFHFVEEKYYKNEEKTNKNYELDLE